MARTTPAPTRSCPPDRLRRPRCGSFARIATSAWRSLSTTRHENRAMKTGALLIAVACVVWSARAHAQTGNPVVAMDSQRDIVLAVANPVDPPPTHAGSSLLGYVPSRNYGAGQRAV